MINHLRTLLLNEKGSNNPGSLYPLEEYTDPAFTPVVMPYGCMKIWNIIFGTLPDRAYKNWRLYQIGQLSESSDLLKYWYKFDSRITCVGRKSSDESSSFNRVTVGNLLNGKSVEFTNSDNGVTVDPSQLPKDSEDVGILLSGTMASNESLGQCKSVWKIELTSSVDLQITDLTRTVTYYDTLSYNGGLSQLVTLPNTGLSIRLRTAVENSWHVDITTKPRTDIGIALANLKNTANLDIEYVLTGAYPEYVIFSDYWHKNSNAAEQLSALCLGLAYKIEEKRAV